LTPGGAFQYGNIKIPINPARLFSDPEGGRKGVLIRRRNCGKFDLKTEQSFLIQHGFTAKRKRNVRHNYSNKEKVGK